MSKFTIKQIMADNWSDFITSFPNVRPVVNKEVLKMINCQNPNLGHALYICEHCGKFKCVPFTCKSRFCNSCGSKYQKARALSLSSKLINCKHRHIVFTIPAELRFLFRKNRFLLHLLFKSAAQTVLDWFSSLNKSQNFKPGIICALHTFGRDLKWNPHIHILLAEIKISNDLVLKWNYFNFDALSIRFQHILLKLLSKHLGKDFNILKFKLLNKYKKGFYIYAEAKKFKSLKAGIEYVTRYCGRVPISENRIINYDGKNVTFSYIDHYDNSYHEITVLAQKFILLLIQHIVPYQYKIIRYYGFYRKKQPIHDKMVLLIDKAKRHIRKTFLKYGLSILKSFNRDPYKCPKCNTNMDFVFEVT